MQKDARMEPPRYAVHSAILIFGLHLNIQITHTKTKKLIHLEKISGTVRMLK